MIPRTIHFIWTGPPLPRWVQANIDRWQSLNPAWRVRLHGEDALAPAYTELYRGLTDVCSRSDLLRLSVLRTFGGWYFDCDFIPFKALDPLYAKYAIDHTFLTMQWGEVGEKWVANGIFAIDAGSPAWSVIDALVADTARGTLERCSFGPLLTTRLATSMDIPLSPPAEFYPWRPPACACIDKAAAVWRGGFTAAAITAAGGGESTAAHLWLGGKYDQPQLDALVDGDYVN
jgi:hypothetical protein